MDFVSLEEVKAMLIAGKTYRCISEELKALYPQKRGFSERSVRRFVAKRNLKKICCHEKLYIVNQSIREVNYDFLVHLFYVPRTSAPSGIHRTVKIIIFGAL